jgi:hypothetical protein
LLGGSSPRLSEQSGKLALLDESSPRLSNKAAIQF